MQYLDKGRPTDYRTEYCKQVQKLCLLGAKDDEIAKFFNISLETFYTWKDKYPDFLEAIKLGKDVADANVASSLYKRACGYDKKETKVYVYRGKVITYDVLKHYPPEPIAAFFWLKNRRKDVWRDRVNANGNDDDEGLLKLEALKALVKNVDNPNPDPDEPTNLDESDTAETPEIRTISAEVVEDENDNNQ